MARARWLLSRDAWRWLDRWQPSQSVVLGGVSLLVGLLAGVGVWLFKRLIDLAHLAVFTGLGGMLAHAGGWTVALLPIVGGLVVGLVVHTLVGHERQHGVAGIIEAVALAGGRLSYWRVPAKAVAAALSIGSGASVGPEDPSVQIGANLGSMFGQWLHLSDEHVRTLVAAGAAGGIAAAFNAPIAGIFFALELILGELSGNAFGIVLAAVVSAVFTQAVSGPQPAFTVPAYAFHSAAELPLYLGLGLLAGPVAALYVRAIYLAQDWFGKWRLSGWLKPAAAGLAVGLIGIGLPQVFGVGYETIGGILSGTALPIWLLLALLAAKLIATAVSVGGGFPGGVFAPALFLGAALGAGYAALVGRALPALGIAPPAFAMVGMAAVLAGTVHAPLTAVILLFEMTNNYRIILPLLFAVVVSLLISQRLQRESVYTLPLARRGIRLQRGRDVEVLETITVAEVMQPDTSALRDTDSLPEAIDLLTRTHHHGLPVLDREDNLVGVLTLQDLERVREAGNTDVPPTVGQVCCHDLLVARPDETIGTAMRRMSTRDIGRLPVVDVHRPHQLLGVLHRADLVRAYDVALSRRASMLHRAYEARLDSFSPANIEDVVVEAGAPCAGLRVSEVRWPHDAVIATLRRGRQIVIPHGDTRLKPGDVLVVVTEGDAKQALRDLCRHSDAPGEH